MVGIALLLVAAALAHGVARALRIPPVPLLLASGVLLARTGRLDAGQIEDTLVLGVAILLFVTGIELAPRRTRTQREASLRVGVTQFFVLAGLGFLTARVIGFGTISALYLALALTASSTLVVIRLLQQRKQIFEPYGRLVIGVLLLQDILVIVFIPILTRLPDGLVAVTLGLVSVAALGLLAYAVLRWASPLLARVDHDEESVLLGIVAVLFGFIFLADRLGLPLVVGAFLAGVALSRFPTSGVVRTQIGSIGDFFSAIFFPALGARLTALAPIEFAQAAAFALLVLLATPPLVAWIAERAGFSARAALEAGLLLSQTSELSLVIGLYAMLEGQIDSNVFTIIALVTAITMVWTPFITADRVLWRLLRLHPARKGTAPVPVSDHVVLLGSGTTGLPLLETLLSARCPVVVVDDDPAVISRLQDADVVCIRGDATDADVLARARAPHARIISSTIRRPGDNRRLLEMTPGVPVLVRVFEESEVEWIRKLGGTPIVYSEAAAENLLRWYDRNRESLARRTHQQP